MVRHAGEERLEKRLAEQPIQVRNMARLFPPGSTVDVRFDGVTSAGALYVVGYRMPDKVLLSDIDPAIKGALRRAKKRAQPYKFTELMPCGKDPEPEPEKPRKRIILPGELDQLD